jgi:hypothetical protein
MSHNIEGFVAKRKDLLDYQRQNPTAIAFKLVHPDYGFLPCINNITLESGLEFPFPCVWISTGGGYQTARFMTEGKSYLFTEDEYKKIGPINYALGIMGVKREGEANEFDTVGLSIYRSMDEFEKTIEAVKELDKLLLGGCGLVE